MAAITGTNGNDNLNGSIDADTINSLLGIDIVNGLGGADTLIVDYSTVPIDPFFAGAMNLPSTVTSSGGAFAGAIKTPEGFNSVTFSNIEHLQATLDTWNNRFVIDAAALALGATIALDGGAGTDTLEADFSALAGVSLQLGAGSGSIGGSTITNFEIYRLKFGSGADNVAAGAGDDMLAGGAGSDTLDGGGGADVLYSANESPFFNPPYVGFPYVAPLLDIGTEVDTLNGGAGEDRLFAGYGDNVDGGGVNDWSADTLYISFLGAPSGVVADFSLDVQVIGGGTIQYVEDTAWVQGSNFADYIKMEPNAGTGRSDVTVFGMGGDDHIVAGYYTSYLDGGEGNDLIDARGSQYLSLIAGGAGDDILYGATHSAGLVEGGDGNDTIYSNGRVYGGAGNDIIVMQRLYTFYPAYGEAGDDDMTAFDTGSSLSGGSGSDTLRGAAGDDVLSAGDFNAYLNLPAHDMGLEHDLLTGGGGSDTIGVGYGDDADGGAGADTLWLSLGGLAAGTTFDTAGIVSGQPFVLGGGTIQNFETLAFLRGSNFNDILTIATQAALLTVDGGDGDDIVTSNGSSVALSGGSGNDRLNSGSAGDSFDGGEGSDTAAYGSALAGIIVTLAPAGQITNGPGGDQLVNVENLEGSGHADSLTGNALANALGGGGGGDQLYGLGGIDELVGGSGDDLLDGGTGADQMIGGGDNDLYLVDNAGDTVVENVGEGIDEVRTGLAAYTLAANVEKLTATSAVNHDFRDNAGNNVVTGGGGNDLLWFVAGGNDSGIGGSGNDVFLFGSMMDGLDSVDGGIGTDQIALQGGSAFTFGSGVVGIESLGLLSGADTRFGGPGGLLHSYGLTTVDANVASGASLTVDGAKLLAGENLTFNGSAETDGSFFIYGGRGVDTLTGGAKNDVFLFGPDGHFGASDVVNGGPGGTDQLALRGNYTVTFGAGQMVGIESIGILSAHDTRFGPLGSNYSYNLTTHDDNVAVGVQMTVDGAKLRGTETLVFNGAAETNGSFRIFGGINGDNLTGSQNGDILQGHGGADRLTGGGGADSFRYALVSDSNSAIMDEILDFTPGTDKIDLSRVDANGLAAGDQAFSWIGSNAFGGVAGQLRAYQSGGDWIVEGDVNGDGSADLVIALTLQGPTPLGTADFLL